MNDHRYDTTSKAIMDRIHRADPVSNALAPA